ncbi:hypothetical protein [Nocardia pneumoniae]|uniref:hypothetical protein n=1 Tax=Nocardia pneumoniae TaxID=228601 RepID=UPI0002F29465|nr:hypothetical protein [Nocardia pneumoniae]
MALINQWVSNHIQPVHGRAELVGPTADALASAYVAAEFLLVHTDVPEETMHAAWSTVGYLATQWTDLVTEVIDGQPCIRDYPRGHQR